MRSQCWRGLEGHCALLRVSILLPLVGAGSSHLAVRGMHCSVQLWNVHAAQAQSIVAMQHNKVVCQAAPIWGPSTCGDRDWGWGFVRNAPDESSKEVTRWRPSLPAACKHFLLMFISILEPHRYCSNLR